MHTLSKSETAAISGAGLLTVVLGRVDNLATQTGGALISTGLALNDSLFSIVQLDGKAPTIELGQLSTLI